MPPSPRRVHSTGDALDAAVRLLSYRPRSESEVRRRLVGRFEQPLIDAAVVRLTEQGLLDDAAFARFWRQNRERHRPKGGSAIRWELLRMGVSREVVEEALNGLDEEENAYRASCGFLRRLGGADYGTFRRKLVAYLHRRGFGSEAVKCTVQRLWQELSDPAYSHIGAEGHGEQQKDGECRSDC